MITKLLDKVRKMKEEYDGKIPTKEVEELMKMEKEELFALLGLQTYIRFDSGVKKEDYREIDPERFHKDKAKAERILGRPFSDEEWNEIEYMNRREAATYRMLDNGEITEEDLDPINGKFDESYQPSLESMALYTKIRLAWGK